MAALILTAAGRSTSTTVGTERSSWRRPRSSRSSDSRQVDAVLFHIQESKTRRINEICSRGRGSSQASRIQVRVPLCGIPTAGKIGDIDNDTLTCCC